MLDYFPNADHAGIYAAQAAGLYEQAGLDVKLQPPPDPSAPLKLLRAGRADLAISYEPELLLARDQGADNLVSVGALVQAPLTSVIALPGSRHQDRQGPRGQARRHVRHPVPERLSEGDPGERGRRSGTVKETNVGFNLTPAMLSKKVDATLGSFWNYEGVDLERRKRDPVILRMEKLGVPTYNELIFVARREALDEAGASRLRRFISATAAGHRLLRETRRRASTRW